MKFGWLIEYNMRNIFIKKLYTKCGGETIPRFFFKKIKIENISFLCQVEDYWNMLKLSCRPLAFTSYKAFLKNKRSGTSFLASFSAWFLKKSISLVIFHYLTKFHCPAAFTLWDNVQYEYCNCLLTSLSLHKFSN